MVKTLRQLVPRSFPEYFVVVLGWLVAATMFGLSLVLFVYHEQLVHTVTFSLTFHVAPPHVWGFLFLVLSTWAALLLMRLDRASIVAYPMYSIAVTLGFWTALLSPTLWRGNGAPTAVVIYLAIALVVTLVAVAFELDGDRISQLHDWRNDREWAAS